MAEDAGAKAGPGEETITLRVRDQGGEEVFFKVKKTTKMQKVRRGLLCVLGGSLFWIRCQIFDAYAQRRGVAPGSLRFMIDGERLNPENTPKMVRPVLIAHVGDL